MPWAVLLVLAGSAAGPRVTLKDVQRMDSLRAAGWPRPLWRATPPARVSRARAAGSDWLPGFICADFACNDDVTGGCPQRAPAVAADSGGGFVVAWYEFRDGDADVWLQRFDAAGAPAGVNERVNTDISYGWQGDPSAAIAPDRGFLFAWEDRRDIGNSDLFCQRFDAGGGRRGENFRVSDSGAAGDQSMSGAHTGPDGSTLIAWDDRRNGITGDIYAQFLDPAGLPRGSNFRVNDDQIGWANQYEPDVSGGDSGRFVVVWMDGRGVNPYDWNVFGQRFQTDGTRIGTNIQVTTDDSIQWVPRVGACPSGGFAVAWDDRRRSQWDVYAQFYSRTGQPIGGNLRVHSDVGTADQYGSSVAGNRFSEYLIVWADRRNGHEDIYGQRFDSAGSRLGAELRLNDDAGTAGQSGPDVAVLPDGGYIVVWSDSRNGDADIYGQRVGRDGSAIGANFRVNDDCASSQQRVSSIGMERLGNICVGWEDERNANTDIYRSVFDAAGRPLDANLRLNDDPGQASQYYTAVAGGQGRFLAAWVDGRDGYDIYGQYLDRLGGLVGPNFRVNTDSAAFQWYPYVAMDSSNRAMVVWMDTRDPGGYSIYCRRYASDGTPTGPEFRVADAQSDQEYASAAMNRAGLSIVAWMDNREGDRHRIYCQRFAGDGTPVGPNFRVNDDTGRAYHGYPACAIAGDGRFVVAWEDTRNETYDAYMQWFDSSGTPLGGNLRVNDDPGENACYSPSGVFDETGRFALAFNDEREVPGNPQLYCQRFGPDRQRIGANQRVNEPNLFPNNHHWTVGQSIAASSEVLAFAWTDNRRHRGWDIFCRVADWNLAGVEETVNTERRGARGAGPTVVRGVLNCQLPISNLQSPPALLDIAGRRVMELRPGANDVRHLAAGVYFIRFEPSAVGREPLAVHVR